MRDLAAYMRKWKKMIAYKDRRLLFSYLKETGMVAPLSRGPRFLQSPSSSFPALTFLLKGASWSKKTATGPSQKTEKCQVLVRTWGSGTLLALSGLRLVQPFWKLGQIEAPYPMTRRFCS